MSNHQKAKIKPWIIYALVDPRNEAIRYVGFTQRPTERFGAHILAARSGKDGTHKACWVKSLLMQGLRPKLEILETGSDASWPEAESRWIATLKARGCDLTNLTEGGEGAIGHIHTPATRAKMSRSSLGKPKSDSHCKNISAAKKLTPISPATRQAQIRAVTGRKQSQEEKDRRAAKLRGQKRSPETVARLSDAWKRRDPAWYAKALATKRRNAKPLSEEARANISAAAKRRVEARKGYPR